jgi:hypothetical protein
MLSYNTRFISANLYSGCIVRPHRLHLSVFLAMFTSLVPPLCLINYNTSSSRNCSLKQPLHNHRIAVNGPVPVATSLGLSTVQESQFISTIAPYQNTYYDVKQMTGLYLLVACSINMIN